MLKPARAAVLWLFLFLGGCVDFGWDALPPAPRDSGPPTVPEGCLEGSADPTDATVVLRFSAMDVDQHLVIVRPGGIIAWINASAQVHTATAGAPGADIPPESGGFDSGRMSPGGATWAFRFCNPRVIDWYCRTHAAQMRDYRIVVE